MKQLISTMALLIAMTLSSFAQLPTNPEPTIGEFEVYRKITPQIIRSEIGLPSKMMSCTKDNESGMQVSEDIYIYGPSDEDNSMEINYRDCENRITELVILKRAPKLAINGELMVGDHINKIYQMGYSGSRISNLDEYKLIEIGMPTFKDVDGVTHYYYIRAYYDENGIITTIWLREDTGI